MWYIYTKEYYIVVKKKMKFSGKRLELEKTIMSELTQHQKEKVICPLSLEAPCSKSSNEYIT